MGYGRHTLSLSSRNAFVFLVLWLAREQSRVKERGTTLFSPLSVKFKSNSGRNEESDASRDVTLSLFLGFLVLVGLAVSGPM